MANMAFIEALYNDSTVSQLNTGRNPKIFTPTTRKYAYFRLN